MNSTKSERSEAANRAAHNRRIKAATSLLHCLARSNVMRFHHDGLVQEMLDADSPAAFNDVKKTRFAAYVVFWFSSLAAVIERYEQLLSSETLPESAEVTALLDQNFKDVIKPFRNSVAHCSDHDDNRTLKLFDLPHSTPDRAALIATRLREHLDNIIKT